MLMSSVQRSRTGPSVVLILASVVVLVMETHVDLSKQFGGTLVVIDAALMIIFTIEYVLRVWIASDGFGGVTGWRGSLRYMRSVYGIIDVLAISPFYLHLVAPTINAGFMRVFRLLRVMLLGRYFKSFSLIRRAVIDKKGEIVVALQLVAVLTLILSVLMFELEHPAQPDKFPNIPSTLAWSVSKFIKDVAGYGKADPVTPLGQVVATLIGLLSVALFALPAGIVASGFIHEVAEDKRQKDLDTKQQRLIRAFRDVHNDWLGRKSPRKFITLAQATSRLNIPENEVIEIAARHAGIRVRHAMQQSSDQYPTVLVIENFEKNTDYGTCMQGDQAITVVCPSSYDELSIGHFGRCLALMTGASLISNELFGAPDALDADAACSFTNNTTYIHRHHHHLRSNPVAGLEATESAWMNALEALRTDVLSSAGNGSLLLIVRAGMPNPKQHDPSAHNGSSVAPPNFSYADAERVRNAVEAANSRGKHVHIGAVAGSSEQWPLHPHLANHTQACVVTLWISENLLHFASLEEYYEVIKRLAEGIRGASGWKAGGTQGATSITAITSMMWFTARRSNLQVDRTRAMWLRRYVCPEYCLRVVPVRSRGVPTVKLSANGGLFARSCTRGWDFRQEVVL